MPSRNFRYSLDMLPVVSYSFVMPSPNRSLIRSLRQRCGLKLGELADLARIKVQHLANIESGYATASVEVLQRIANALNSNLPENSTEIQLEELFAEQVAS